MILIKMNKEYFKRFVKTETEKIKNNEVWVYTRVSSKNQFDSNHSIENQIHYATRLAEKMGYKITREFGNTYESAKDDFTRKEFTKLINEVKDSKKKPFGIMIYKMSRFSRSGGSAIGLVDDLEKTHGVHLIEVSTETDTSTVTGELRIIDSLVHARRENVERLTFTIPGLKSFVSRGNWLGKSPRGYDHYGPRVKNPKFVQGTQELKINEEGKLLRLAWQWKLQNISDHQIIDKLKVRGLKVTKQFVSSMWRNPFYCGIQVNKFMDGEVLKGNWEGLVSEEDFRTVNDRFESKPKNEYDPYTNQQSRPLQNQLYCGCCGSKMTGYKAKGKFDYYKCLNSKCKSKDLNANTSKKSLKEGIHNVFSDLLSSLKLNETLQGVFKEQMKLTINGQNEVFFEEENRLKNRIEELNRKLDGLDRKYAFDDLDKDLYTRFKNETVSELRTVQLKLEDFQIRISNLDKKVEDLVQFSEKLSEIWSFGDYETKVLVQKLIFPKGIVINPVEREYRTSDLNPIFRLIHSFTRDDGGRNKKRTGRNTDPSCVVARAGLEPATFGL